MKKLLNIILAGSLAIWIFLASVQNEYCKYLERVISKQDTLMDEEMKLVLEYRSMWIKEKNKK